MTFRIVLRKSHFEIQNISTNGIFLISCDDLVQVRKWFGVGCKIEFKLSPLYLQLEQLT